MGKFQDSINSFWETLSNEDVKETQEYKFSGELAGAMQEQEGQERLQVSLLSTFHKGENSSKKGNYRVDNTDNINENNKGIESIKKLDDNDRGI